jgi:putative ABC transport system permease protein
MTRDSLSNFVPGMTITPGIALAAVALMIGLGVVTGLVPALNAFRLRIATALGRG